MDLSAKLREARALRALREKQIQALDSDLYRWMVSGGTGRGARPSNLG